MIEVTLDDHYVKSKTFYDLFLEIQGKESKLIHTENIVDYKVHFCVNGVKKHININFCGYPDARKFAIFVLGEDNIYLYDKYEVYNLNISNFEENRVSENFDFVTKFIEISRKDSLEINSEFYKKEIKPFVESQGFFINEKLFKSNTVNNKDYLYLTCSCGENVKVNVFRVINNYLLNKNMVCKKCSLLENTIPKELIEKFKIKNKDLKKSWRGNEPIEVTCDKCGKVKNIKARSFKQSGFRSTCECYSKSISFSEKFFYILLKELGIPNEREKKFKWSIEKRYDFYLPCSDTIVELHGIQHYDKSKDFSRAGGRSYADEVENDILKFNLANKNNIKEYIVINCTNASSNVDYFFESLISNENLNRILKQKYNKEINFNFLKQIYLKNHDLDINYERMINVVELASKGMSVTEIYKETNIDRKCVGNLLKKATCLGLYNYEPNKHINLSDFFNEIQVYSINSEELVCTIHHSSNLKEISKILNMAESSLRRYIKRETPPKHFNFVFK